VSLEAADHDYGVVFTGEVDDDTLAVDHDATRALRADLRDERGEVVAFFDRGPGYAQLDPDGRSNPDVDVR
jgi:N-methylhydantoinase B